MGVTGAFLQSFNEKVTASDVHSEAVLFGGRTTRSGSDRISTVTPLSGSDELK